MKVIEHNYKWNGELGIRVGEPRILVHHHEAGYGDVMQIHKQHVALGWRGIAYHYLVRRNGEIHRGRPEWAVGGHATGYGDALGICAEGELHKYRMPKAQREALRELTRDIHRRHKGIIDKKHGSLPGNATACPGKYYPFAYITRPVSGNVPVRKRAELKKLLVRWAEVYNNTHPKDTFEIPKVKYTAWWGSGARLLAKRVTYRLSKRAYDVEFSERPTVELYNLLKK